MSDIEVADQSPGVAQLRVSAIGTSNLVLRNGIRQPLETDPRIFFRNFAVGASGTVLMGLRLDQAQVEQADLLLVEFAVNEERFVPEGSSSLEAVTNAMRFAIDRACRAGCIPVLLLLPHLQFLEATPVANAMRAVFERAGLPIFDIADMVRRCAHLSRIEPGALFRDTMHLKPAVARAFGVLLIEALLKVPLDKRPKLQESAAYRPLQFVAVTELIGAGHPSVFKRRSRLIEVDVAHLESNETLYIPSLGDRTAIVGVVSNSARTRGLLRSEDGDKLYFHMPEARWSDDPAAFTLVARPIEPIRIPKSGKEFVVVPLRSAGQNELAQIEFCGLIVRIDGERIRMSSAPVAGRWRDLTAQIDETALRMIATLAHTED